MRIDETGAGTAFEAGEGAEYAGFWPTSSVKLLAAVGTLDYRPSALEWGLVPTWSAAELRH